MEKNNRNVFLDVELKNPAEPIAEEEVLETPPPPPKPEEEQIFKKKELVLQKPEESKKDRKTNQKRVVTPKMAAHLERIRKLAAESKAKKKAEKEAKNPKKSAPQSAPLETIPEEPSIDTRQPPLPSVPVPQPVRQPVASVGSPNIDYDRIINGLWNKQQQQTQLAQQMNQYREQIRQEERKKAFNESKTLFMQAAENHRKKQSQNMGLQALRGFTPQHNHPVFKQKNTVPQSAGQSANPFDVCFK